MELSPRTLNRTLLQRQHLLARSDLDALTMTEHLVGLQAQDPLPPYVSLAARIDDFDPEDLSETLEDRTTVRLLLMRGTIHLVSAHDALALRPYVQPMLDRLAGSAALSRTTSDVPRDALVSATHEALAAGPLTVSRLGKHLEERFPGSRGNALATAARVMTPLVQVPPRGLWKRSGGVSYDSLQGWLGAELPTAPDHIEVARRYLRAFGPAMAADLTAWSGVSGARELLTGLRDELVVHRDQAGRELFDLCGLEIAEEDLPAPVRLLGKYDNVWLSHSARDRVTPDADKRRRWMGANGGVGNTVFVDGVLEGLWAVTDAGRVELDLFRRLSKDERLQLRDEVDRLQVLIARH